MTDKQPQEAPLVAPAADPEDRAIEAALRPKNLAVDLRESDRDIAWEGSAAVIVPTLLLAAALRRRARGNGHGSTRPARMA